MRGVREAARAGRASSSRPQRQLSAHLICAKGSVQVESVSGASSWEPRLLLQQPLESAGRGAEAGGGAGVGASRMTSWRGRGPACRRQHGGARPPPGLCSPSSARERMSSPKERRTGGGCRGESKPDTWCAAGAHCGGEAGGHAAPCSGCAAAAAFSCDCRASAFRVVSGRQQASCVGGGGKQAEGRGCTYNASDAARKAGLIRQACRARRSRG